MQLIAIDLGSNTLQVTKFDCQKKEITASFLATVRTAQDLHKTKKISNEAIQRIITALKRAQEKIDFKNIHIKAVTTQAMRVALNAKEAIESIKNATNIEFQIISPQKEAILTLEAVKFRLEKLDILQNFVLVDIGGASTEISFYIDDKVYAQSFDFGIVTVANSTNSLDEIPMFIEEKLQAIKKFVSSFELDKLIFCATAGTPTTIAALKHNLNYESYDAKIVTGTKLFYDELDFYLHKLLAMDIKERQIAVGVGREDLILAGVIIFQKIFEILHKKEVIVIDDGLSVGVALQECQNFMQY